VTLRSRLSRLERHWPRTDPEELWHPTLDERATLLSKVLGRLGRADPFPALQGRSYLDAFKPWYKAGGIYPPGMVEVAEENPPVIGLFS
jgi:hypothetical protein